MEKWKGKVALVTGASVGIGEAIAKILSKNGMTVVACARNISKLETIVAESEGTIFPIKCDLKIENQILSMFQIIKEKFGCVHVCVNNAGLAHRTGSYILTGETEGLREMFDVNVLALCICTRESVKLMRDNGVDDGHIINIGSVAGHKVYDKPTYSATKFAVRAITEGVRKELVAAGSHIRSTEISPGFVETEFAYRLFKGKEEKAEELYSSMECLKANDIAEGVVYALSCSGHVNVNEIIIRPTEQLS